MFMYEPNTMKSSHTPLAIITGGSGYLGSSMASSFKKAGWEVFVLSRETGCDITDSSQVETKLSTLGERPISACIHAAAAPPTSKKISELEPNIFAEEMRTAVVGAANVLRHALPRMNEESVFIGITTKLIEPNITSGPLGGYLSTKYALRGFLRTIAQEEKRLRVYAVAPGYMPGGLNSKVPQTILSFLAQKSGAGQTSAEEVSELIVKLCTDTAAFPSGSSIVVPEMRASPL